MSESLTLGQRVMKKALTLAASVVVLGILGFVLYSWAAVNYVYAQGERAGYVQKFSKKG